MASVILESRNERGRYSIPVLREDFFGAYEEEENYKVMVVVFGGSAFLFYCYLWWNR